MKYLVIPFVLFVIPFWSGAQITGNSQEINSREKAKYPFVSATITYAVTGDASGTSILYFDRNGWRSAFTKEISFNRYGIQSTERTVELIDGDYLFTVNMESGKGKKSTNKNWSSLISYKDNTSIISAIIEDQGGKLDRLDTLLGKPCRVWVFENHTTSDLWEYQGIPLKINKKLPGYSYSLEASSIETGQTPQPSVFQLSDSIQWSVSD